jgi:hypothetical protein
MHTVWAEGPGIKPPFFDMVVTVNAKLTAGGIGLFRPVKPDHAQIKL